MDQWFRNLFRMIWHVFSTAGGHTINRSVMKHVQLEDRSISLSMSARPSLCTCPYFLAINLLGRGLWLRHVFSSVEYPWKFTQPWSQTYCWSRKECSVDASHVFRILSLTLSVCFYVQTYLSVCLSEHLSYYYLSFSNFSLFTHSRCLPNAINQSLNH